MASVTIRNLSEETHRALKMLAAQHGRSTEGEIRVILENAARPEGRCKLGSLLGKIGMEAGGFELDVERDKTPSDPMSFE